ncbi:MAG: helix-turn-helix transcriptional regulator [Clostridiales bacterium]|nr:helix-turn-helix transcriptional regulator [Clostridiales bacterium]
MKELLYLSKNLKELRKEMGLTQKEVAVELNITYQSYQAYELGLTIPTLQNFIKLAKLFEVPYEELLQK